MTSIETSISAGAEVVCAGLVHVYTSEQGPIAALRNADLVAEAGEMLAIVGPSGSGKTTLMLLLSRPAPADRGLGVDRRPGHHPARRAQPQPNAGHQASLLLQDPLRNLRPMPRSTRTSVLPRAARLRRGWPLRWSTGEIVERMGLAELADRPVYRLSAGQQNRAAIASALATSPSRAAGRRADGPTRSSQPRHGDRRAARRA